MSSLDDISTCGDDNGDEVNKKECTSCEQKVDEHCKFQDGVSSGSSNSSSAVDAVADDIEKIGISNNNNNNNNNDDEKLFQDPPPKEDCPICLLPMPHANAICGVPKTYMACCGKLLCSGCVLAAQDEIRKGNIKEWCLFCRTPIPKSNAEYTERVKKRMKLKDAGAYFELGCAYDEAIGLPHDANKARELWHQAAELGSCQTHYSLGRAYLPSRGVEKDMKKAMHHWKLAAIGGHERARFNMGVFEYNEGNIDIAMKHYMISAKAGYDKSLKKVGEGYKAGYVTKHDYAKTLRAYQLSMDEMKSEQRTIANSGCN